jgi:hypothetical protein
MLFCLAGAANSNPVPAQMNAPISIPMYAGEAPFYTETIDCGSITQAELFRRARLYLAQSVPDNKILISDKETGDLASQGNVTISIPRSENASGGAYMLRYVLTVECANRKYRATVSNIDVVDGGSAKIIPWAIFVQKSEKESKAIHTELEIKMRSLVQELQSNVKDYKPF